MWETCVPVTQTASDPTNEFHFLNQQSDRSGDGQCPFCHTTDRRRNGNREFPWCTVNQILMRHPCKGNVTNHLCLYLTQLTKQFTLKKIELHWISRCRICEYVLMQHLLLQGILIAPGLGTKINIMDCNTVLYVKS